MRGGERGSRAGDLDGALKRTVGEMDLERVGVCLGRARLSATGGGLARLSEAGNCSLCLNEHCAFRASNWKGHLELDIKVSVASRSRRWAIRAASRNA